MPHLPDHHAEHDPQLVAAFAAGDAEGADLERAQALVAGCTECALLHHDLRAIASSMPSLPAPTRTRDFRLRPEQAASLRPSGWRRLLAPLGGPRFAFAAPLGGSLAALGLAGILVAGAASMPLPGTGTAPVTGSGVGAGATDAARQDQAQPTAVEASLEPGAGALSAPASPAASDNAYLAAPVPAASAAAAAPDAGAAGGAAGAAPAASGVPVFGAGTEASNVRQEVPSAAAVAGPIDASSTPVTTSLSGVPPVIPIVSVVLLLAGIVLLVLGLVGRRLGRAAHVGPTGRTPG